MKIILEFKVGEVWKILINQSWRAKRAKGILKKKMRFNYEILSNSEIRTFALSKSMGAQTHLCPPLLKVRGHVPRVPFSYALVIS